MCGQTGHLNPSWTSGFRLLGSSGFNTGVNIKGPRFVLLSFFFLIKREQELKKEGLESSKVCHQKGLRQEWRGLVRSRKQEPTHRRKTHRGRL